jgi:hypothetical protein
VTVCTGNMGALAREVRHPDQHVLCGLPGVDRASGCNLRVIYIQQTR